MKYFIIPVMLLVLVGCATVKTVPAKMTAFPPSPQWASVKDPVIERRPDGTYVVKEGLVQYGLQAKKWVKRVETWKVLNQVP